LRRPGRYHPPRYHDPNDIRFVSIVRKGESAEEGAVNILGVPYDGAVLGRKGAAEGPDAIRAALSGFSNYNIEEGSGLVGAKVVDLGDIVVEVKDVDIAHAAIEDEVFQQIKEGSLLLVLGGDNSVSLPSLRALERKFDRIGLVVIDSHLDLRGKINGKATSGSSYGLALESVEGLDPSKVVEVGAHGFLNSQVYVERAKEKGITVITAQDVRLKGTAAVAKEAYVIASKGTDAVYLSIDLDAVDLSEVSGVSAPSSGGISGQELYDMARIISGGRKTVCADIVELAPSLDPTGRSQVVAATTFVYVISGFKSKRGA
jgi:formimidoylglutamase